MQEKEMGDSMNKNSNSKPYNNDSNFKYNPNLNKGEYSGTKEKDIKCSYCNIKGHKIEACRYRQKHDYNNADNAGAGVMWCKYCHCAGHLIAACIKRKYNENKKANADSNTGGNTTNFRDKRCFNCNETSHIAMYCPKRNQNF